MMNKYIGLVALGALVAPALAADVSMDSVILIPRTAPATPTNGQCWTATTGLYCRINGTTVGPYGTGGGGVANIASGTAAIASGVCAAAVVSAGAGVLTTDPVEWGFNADPTAVVGYTPGTAGMLTIIAYPTANNVNFKVCNNTSASVTPGAITLNWRVAR